MWPRSVGEPDLNSNAVIDFGEWYKPMALTMQALLAGAKSNETHNANITPFTHMAAARAKADAVINSSNLDATTVANANSEVSNLLGGIDILNTTPVDITDPAILNGAELSQTQVIYASLSSALANQGVVDANGQPKLNEAINLLAASFEQGSIQADASSGAGGQQITFQDIVTATAQTLAQAGVSDVTGVLSGLQSTIDTAVANGGVIDPAPSDTANLPDMAKVKAMVSDVRTWGNVIRAEVQNSGTAFALQVKMASDAANVLSTNSASALGAAITAMLEFDSTQTNLGSSYYNNILLSDALEGEYYFDGTAADYSVDGGLDGTLIYVANVIESSDNWIDANIGLTFVAQLTGLPEARVNINADRTGFDAGDVNMTVNYGSRQLTFSTAVTANEAGSITITNQDNVVFNIAALPRGVANVSLLTGGLTYNGKVYASVEETANGLFKISYEDGTFEIF